MNFPRIARRSTALLGGVALLALASLPASAQDAATGYSVDGYAVTSGDLKAAETDIGNQLPAGATPEQKKEMVSSYFMDLYLAAEKAGKEKLVSDDEMKERLDYLRRKVLMEALLTKITKEATTDEAARKFYAEKVKDMPADEEVHARHILVKTEDEAKKVEERLKAGEDFAKVAKEVSQDPGSADGGDLGWFTKDRMVKEFAEAAFALKAGELSKPVKSQFGWHVIRLEERRPKAPPTFEQVKPQIIQFLTRKAQDDLIMALRKDAKIVKPEAPKAEEKPAGDAPKPAEPAPAEAPKP